MAVYRLVAAVAGYLLLLCGRGRPVLLVAVCVAFAPLEGVKLAVAITNPLQFQPFLRLLYSR